MKKLFSVFLISLFLSGTALAASTGSGGTPPPADPVKPATTSTGSETTGTISTSPTPTPTPTPPPVPSSAPAKTVSKPVTTTPVVAEAKHCGVIEGNIQDRVNCRLNADEATLKLEQETAYFPEGCRRGTTEWQEACKARYKAIGPCWDPVESIKDGNYDSNIVMTCIREKLTLPEVIVPTAEYCKGKPKGCSEDYKKMVYNLIIARFYDAEERSEILLRQGRITKEQASNFITYISQAKLDFYDAKDKATRQRVIKNVISTWQQLIKNIK